MGWPHTTRVLVKSLLLVGKNFIFLPCGLALLAYLCLKNKHKLVLRIEEVDNCEWESTFGSFTELDDSFFVDEIGKYKLFILLKMQCKEQRLPFSDVAMYTASDLCQSTLSIRCTYIYM